MTYRNTKRNLGLYGCQAQSLDLSSFDTSKVTDMEWMLDGCQARIKATDSRILAKRNE